MRWTLLGLCLVATTALGQTDSVADDQAQLGQLATQSRGAAVTALADGDITATEKSRVDRWLDRVERKQALGKIPSGPFRGMCRYFVRTRS